MNKYDKKIFDLMFSCLVAGIKTIILILIGDKNIKKNVGTFINGSDEILLIVKDWKNDA